jgi:hypothetical protein
MRVPVMIIVVCGSDPLITKISRVQRHVCGLGLRAAGGHMSCSLSTAVMDVLRCAAVAAYSIPTSKNTFAQAVLQLCEQPNAPVRSPDLVCCSVVYLSRWR